MATPQKTLINQSTKRLRWMIWSIAFIVMSAMLLPMTGYLFPAAQTTVHAQQSDSVTNQRSEFWRLVREGGSGYSAVQGSDANIETGTLYNTTGQNWRQIRNGLIANYGGWFLFFVAVGILAFYSTRGRVELSEPATGERVPRWTRLERTLHWYTAILFICLAISGLSLLFGRAILIPLLGPPGFSLWADFSINTHNTLGPFFTIGPILMFFCWVRHNIPTGTDIKWFVQGGGIIGRKHPSAGKANGGEKVWFWIVILLGLCVVCLTGFALIGWAQEYLGFENTRAMSQQMHVIHAVASILWIAVFLGHVYIGTVGSQGSLDAMSKGHVSVEWAKQHHDLWYDKVKSEGQIEAEKTDSSVTSS